jgi:phage gpG-like protein
MSVEFNASKMISYMKDLRKRTKEVTDADKKFASSIAIMVYKDILDHFKKESGPQGKWKAWSKAYAEHKRKIGKGGDNILQDSRRMVQNLTPESYRVRSSEIEWFNNTKAEDGTPYAYYHNEGAGGMPERRFMWLSKSVEQKLLKASLAYITSEG